MRISALSLGVSVLLLPGSLLAQGQLNGAPRQTPLYTYGSTAVIAGQVVTQTGDPVPNATVILDASGGIGSRLLRTNYQGWFQAEQNTFANVEMSDVTATLRVKKEGYLEAHRFIDFGESGNTSEIRITLFTPGEDPALLSQQDLVDTLAPRLKQLAPGDGLLKQEKDYAHGVQQFLESHQLIAALRSFSKVAKRNPSCLKCRTMLALAMLEWGDWDGAEQNLRKSVNALLADRKLGCPEPLDAYGVLLMNWQHDRAKAAGFFTEALKYAPEDPLALQELGRIDLLDGNWPAASDRLQKAVAAGAGPEAQLLYAQVLLWTGTADEASAQLSRYLNGRELTKMPLRVRALARDIEEKKKNEVAFMKARLKAAGEPVIDYLHHPPPNLPQFSPATDQTQLEPILSAVAKNVSDLFANLPNTCSVEKLSQQKLSRKGKLGASQEHQYRYLALTLATPWGPNLDEYRADSENRPLPGAGEFMVTAGFISGPIIFHPMYQSGSTFALLGQEKLEGRDTFVIAFAQEPGKSRIYGCFYYDKSITRTYTQGIAWIDAQNYQIVRLISDLLVPLPKIKLKKQTTDIEFSEIGFNTIAKRFWLPHHVSVTIDWNGTILRNEHDYSDFLEFNVEAREKLGQLQGAGNGTVNTPSAGP